VAVEDGIVKLDRDEALLADMAAAEAYLAREEITRAVCTAEEARSLLYRMTKFRNGKEKKRN
jgi:hypothetical protein